MNILRKIQHQPEKTRKIIFWFVIIVFAFGLLFWWVNNLQKRLTDFQGEQFIQELRLPAVETPKFEMPKFEMPEISEEGLQKLKEIIEQKPHE